MNFNRKPTPPLYEVERGPGGEFILTEIFMGQVLYKPYANIFCPLIFQDGHF